MSNPKATNQATPRPEQKGNELAIIKKNITDSVMSRIQPMIENKEIRLPSNYSVGNAMQSAWLELLEIKTKDGRSALESCSQSSIANALYKMCIWGLSVAKKQVAFIAYGDQLRCNPEYHGNIALARRYGNVKDVYAGVVYKDDEFKFAVDVEGRKSIVIHNQALENIKDNDIIGAYAVLTFEGEKKPYLEIMSMDQIRKSWMQGATQGNSPAHKNFPGEMAKKTVISRACKLFWTTSDDSALMETDDDDLNSSPATDARNAKVNQEGNKGKITTEDVPYEDVTQSQPPAPPAQADNQEDKQDDSASLSDLGKDKSGDLPY